MGTTSAVDRNECFTYLRRIHKLLSTCIYMNIHEYVQIWVYVNVYLFIYITIQFYYRYMWVHIPTYLHTHKCTHTHLEVEPSLFNLDKLQTPHLTSNLRSASIVNIMPGENFLDASHAFYWFLAARSIPCVLWARGGLNTIRKSCLHNILKNGRFKFHTRYSDHMLFRNNSVSRTKC